MPDVGDSITATLLVQPFDATTRADLVATRPDGSSLIPICSTTDGGQTWTAPIELDLAGSWVLKWTVTGMGSSVEYEEIGVGPGLAQTPTGRIYATTTDLALFLHDAPPPGAAKKLQDASRALDRVLLTAVYATDNLGMPSDPVQAKAMADATCSIVEWWMETGDELGAEGDWTSASAGGVSLSRNPGSTVQVSGQRIPWKAWNLLTEARILPGVIYQR